MAFSARESAGLWGVGSVWAGEAWSRKVAIAATDSSVPRPWTAATISLGRNGMEIGNEVDGQEATGRSKQAHLECRCAERLHACCRLAASRAGSKAPQPVLFRLGLYVIQAGSSVSCATVNKDECRDFERSDGFWQPVEWGL